MIKVKECKTCDCHNKLRCMVSCKPYQAEALKRAHEYNLFVFGDPSFGNSSICGEETEPVLPYDSMREYQFEQAVDELSREV